MKSKILVFYSGYLPGTNYGGPVTSLFNFTELLGDVYDIYIVTSNHDLNSSKPYKDIGEGWNTVGKAQVRYLPNDEFGKTVFLSIVDEVRPSLVYVSSIFSAIINEPLYSICKNRNVPMLLAPRGELNPDALKLKSLKKFVYLKSLLIRGSLKNIVFQATSYEEKLHICSALGVNESRVLLLSNIPVAAQRKSSLEKTAGRLKVLFIARIVENKNLKYAIELVSQLKQDVEMDVFGPIENEEYWNQCKSLIGNTPDNIKIKYKGQLNPAEAKSIYLSYDCLIFPTRFENYGQVIAEALNHDCIPVISKGTTPWDDINDCVAPLAFNIGDNAGFIAALSHIADADTAEYTELIRILRTYASEKTNSENIKAEYIAAFDTLIN